MFNTIREPIVSFVALDGAQFTKATYPEYDAKLLRDRAVAASAILLVILPLQPLDFTHFDMLNLLAPVGK